MQTGIKQDKYKKTTDNTKKEINAQMPKKQKQMKKYIKRQSMIAQ